MSVNSAEQLLIDTLEPGTNRPIAKRLTVVGGDVVTTAGQVFLYLDNNANLAYVGTPTDNTFGTKNVPGILTTDLIADGFDKVCNILEQLMPPAPPNLGTFTSLILDDPTYSAYQGIAPYALVNNVCNNPTGKPSITLPSFGNASMGVLSAYVKNDHTSAYIQGSIALTNGDNTGVFNDFLEILSDADYYPGQPGKMGFYNALTARIGGNNVAGSFAPSNDIVYTMQLRHNVSGNTNTVSFYQDDAYTSLPSVGYAEITAVSGTTGYVSGLPVYTGAGFTLTTSITCINCVKKFYNSNWIARVSGPEIITATILPVGSQRNDGSNPTVTITTSLASGGVYNSNLAVTVTVQNSAGTQATALASHATDIVYIDTVSLQPASPVFSPESNRIDSGTGLYPTQSLVAYNPSDSLTLNYELQLINGYYQDPPSINYTTGYIPPGPDYSALIYDGGFRHYTQNMGAITTASTVTVTILHPVNFGVSVIIPGIRIFVAVVGSGMGWISANNAYPGSGIPTNDGDPALDISSSTSTVRRVTFGGALRTGTVLCRISLPQGSNIKFGGFSLAWT